MLEKTLQIEAAENRSGRNWWISYTWWILIISIPVTALNFVDFNL